MTIDEISKPIENHLHRFNDYFTSLMKSNVALLDLIIQYIAKKRGKQVRPVILFLSASLCGEVNERSYMGAAMVELLHTATLIHDDVVDQAKERRGMPSINAEWNNKIAVLVGDFLLGKGLLTSIEKDELGILHASAKAVRRMSEGELLQIQKSMDFTVDEATYYQIISDKTASLLSSCCEIGAISATDNIESQKLLTQYGEYVGTAFQIKDDIFDFQSKSSILGKPVGNDLKEKKLTLPLIYSLSQVTKSTADEIKALIRKGNLTKKNIHTIIQFVNDYGGIDYSEKKAIEFSQKAVDTIAGFNNCPAKESLIMLASFVVNRES